MKNAINHTGIIERIEGSSVFVKIRQQSACADCHAQSMCGASECKDKTIEVFNNSKAFRINESVIISGESSMGLLAVLLAFVLPLIIIITVIIIGTNLNWNESTSALLALSFLFPYYSIIYLMRDKLKKKFIFTLKKQINDIP